MQNFTRLALGLGAAAVVAAGGSAFTASNTLGGDNVVGFASDTVTGATSTAIEHTLSADGLYVLSTSITFQGDANTSPQVMAGFDAGNLTSCTVTRTTTMAPYTAACSYTSNQYSTAAATSFHVAVS